jgi:hypothetical protein
MIHVFWDAMVFCLVCPNVLKVCSAVEIRPTHPTTKHHIQEHLNLQNQHCENLKAKLVHFYYSSFALQTEKCFVDRNFFKTIKIIYYLQIK